MANNFTDMNLMTVGNDNSVANLHHNMTNDHTVSQFSLPGVVSGDANFVPNPRLHRDNTMIGDGDILPGM